MLLGANRLYKAETAEVLEHFLEEHQSQCQFDTDSLLKLCECTNRLVLITNWCSLKGYEVIPDQLEIEPEYSIDYTSQKLPVYIDIQPVLIAELVQEINLERYGLKNNLPWYHVNSVNGQYSSNEFISCSDELFFSSFELLSI